jgi:membrane-associated HD superfamily phosphohydrolase
MLNGGNTSPFKDVAVSTTNLVSSASMLLISPMIVTAAISYVKDTVQSYLTSKVGEMTSTSFLGEIPGVIAQYTKAYTYTPEEILKYSGSMDEVHKKEQEKSDKEEQEKTISSINETVSKVKNICDKSLGTVNKSFESITKYLDAGSAWVEKQVEKTAEKTIKNIEKNIAEQAEIIENKKQEFVDNYGKKAGRKAADKINNKAISTAKATQNKIIKKTKEALNKAKALAQTLIMKLIGLLGV